MKKVSLFVLLWLSPLTARAAATCPTGYITVDMPDVEIASSCDAGYTSAGTIDDCTTSAGVCAVADITCKPGQFIQDGECKVCSRDNDYNGYYCPDGVSAKTCPLNYVGIIGWPWCESEWPENENGTGHWGCSSVESCIDHYLPYTASHGSGTWRCSYNATTEKYDRNCGMPELSRCDAGYYKDTGTTNYPTDCKPVGVGYYSPADSKYRTECPTGYTTSTTTATSEDECNVCADSYGMHDGRCVPLCTAGATMLHVGPHTFNLYPDEACERPAIHIDLSGGTCCAHLVKGEVSGAMHVRYNGEVYHTTN